MPDLIEAIPQSFLDEFEAEIKGRIPQEKIQAELRQQGIARVMAAAGSVYIPEVGQKIAEIDGRLYFRMLNEAGGDQAAIFDYLKDNPSLCAPGFKPGRKGTRHGITFVNGRPTGVGPHSEKYK